MTVYRIMELDHDGYETVKLDCIPKRDVNRFTKLYVELADAKGEALTYSYTSEVDPNHDMAMPADVVREMKESLKYEIEEALL